MACTKHENHGGHAHGAGCGHEAVTHEDHTDYLHGGHLHHVHGDHIDEHQVSVSARNPSSCTSGHGCAGHSAAHTHGAGCGHPTVPHGDHLDYLVDGHLHNLHSGHCDDHGQL
jgi:hypothetical protein